MTNQFAADAQIKNEFGMVGKYGYTAELVAAQSKNAEVLGQHFVNSINVAKTSIGYAAGAAAATLGVLGTLDAQTIGLAAAAGAIKAFTK